MGIAVSIDVNCYKCSHMSNGNETFFHQGSGGFPVGLLPAQNHWESSNRSLFKAEANQISWPMVYWGFDIPQFCKCVYYMDFHMRLLLRKYNNDTWILHFPPGILEILHFPPGILEKHLSWCLGSIFNLVAGTISSWRLDPQILRCFTCPRFTTQLLWGYHWSST